MPIPAKTKPFNRSFMREAVYSTLLGWIVEGELQSGEKLLDKELAESMGVSRTPVREALRRLEDKGLVESAANRWTRVSELSIDEPKRIYPIIWTLEELAVSEALDRMTRNDIIMMESVNERLREAVEAERPVEASQADIEFHEVFIKRSENPYLIAILRDLKIAYRRVEITYFQKGTSGDLSFGEHRDLLEALKNGDLPQTQAMIRLNWQNSLQRLQQRAATRDTNKPLAGEYQ